MSALPDYSSNVYYYCGAYLHCIFLYKYLQEACFSYLYKNGNRREINTEHI